MEKKGVLGTLRFLFFTILVLVLIFSAVVITVLNMYKPTVKAFVDGKFIGYFASEQQFDEVYNDLVTEKQNIDSNVKVYLENEPSFETSYIRENILAKQNVYDNLRAEVKTEYTIYDVAVDGEKKMTFNNEDDANKYAEQLKSQVAKLNVEVKKEKKAELEDVTSIERADSILKDIVDRNKPVETPKVDVTPKKTTTTNKNANTNVATIGAASTPATGSGVWPTVNRRVNCQYMGYSGHTGIDLGGAIGTAIYAYRPGTVTFAGWGTGYGKHVIINHGNGMTTYYAHCSELLVSVGQQVSEGQLIAKIGMTGYTTGPHVHFEVRLNGVPVNPYPYIAGK